MFVRKKRNRSGSTSIVVVDKSNGIYREVKSFGASSDADEIGSLSREASAWISKYGGQQLFDFDETQKAITETRNTISRIERTLQNAPQSILNRVYDSIGFGAMGDDILRHLVVARVCQPLSKVATVEYLKSYFDQDVQKCEAPRICWLQVYPWCPDSERVTKIKGVDTFH